MLRQCRNVEHHRQQQQHLFPCSTGLACVAWSGTAGIALADQAETNRRSSCGAGFGFGGRRTGLKAIHVFFFYVFHGRTVGGRGRTGHRVFTPSGIQAIRRGVKAPGILLPAASPWPMARKAVGCVQTCSTMRVPDSCLRLLPSGILHYLGVVGGYVGGEGTSQARCGRSLLHARCHRQLPVLLLRWAL